MARFPSLSPLPFSLSVLHLTIISFDNISPNWLCVSMSMTRQKNIKACLCSHWKHSNNDCAKDNQSQIQAYSFILKQKILYLMVFNSASSGPVLLKLCAKILSSPKFHYKQDFYLSYYCNAKMTWKYISMHFHSIITYFFSTYHWEKKISPFPINILISEICRLQNLPYFIESFAGMVYNPPPKKKQMNIIDVYEMNSTYDSKFHIYL